MATRIGQTASEIVVTDIFTDFEKYVGAIDPDTYIGSHPAVLLPDGADTLVYGYIMIPKNFHTLTSAHVIIVPAASGNMRRSISTTWGVLGAAEDYNIDTGSIVAGQVAVTQNRLESIDISAALIDIAANDLVGFTFTREGSNVNDTVNADCYYLGGRIRYV